MSARWSADLESSACSGAMKSTGPHVRPRSASASARRTRPSGLVASITRARPRSSTRTVPEGSSIRLPGLTSRWMIPCACAASSPRAAWIDAVQRHLDRQRADLADQAVEVVPLDVLHRQELDPPVLVGLDRRDDVGVVSRAAISNSRRNRSTASRSRPNEGRRIFRATTRPDRRCRALKTTPMPPWPALVEHEIVADDEPPRLPLGQRPGLVGGQLARPDQRPGPGRATSPAAAAA